MLTVCLQQSFSAAIFTQAPCFTQVRSVAFSLRLPFTAAFFSGRYVGFVAEPPKGNATDAAWVYASVWVAELMESMGCPIDVQGMDAVTAVDGPACLWPTI